MVLNNKLFKIHIEVLVLKIMMIYQNGSQRMKKGIISKSNQLLKNNFNKKNKD